MLVSECIDRVFSEIFWPSGIDRPTYDLLSEDVDAATLEIPTAGRVNSIPRDTMLEVGDELILVEGVSTTTVTANGRGWLNTTPASHAEGSRVYIDPQYTRQAVFNALKACIGLLYPWGLYRRAIIDGPTWDSKQAQELPTGTLDVMRVLVQDNPQYENWSPLTQRGDQWEFIPEFEPPRIRYLRGGGLGRSTKVVTARDFTVPELTTEDLDDCGISATLQPFLPLCVAGYILQNREVPRVQIDDVRRLLAAQGVQLGASLNVGQSMVAAFRSVYVTAEAARLRRLDPMTFEFVGR